MGVFAVPGVVLPGELPTSWGLWELDKGRWTYPAQAPKLTPELPPRVFLAAILRRAMEANESLVATAIEDARREEIARYDKRVQQEVEHRTHRHEELTRAVAKFEEASGVKIGESWQAGDIGRAVAVVRANGQKAIVESAKRVRDRLTALIDECAGEVAGTDDNA